MRAWSLALRFMRIMASELQVRSIPLIVNPNPSKGGTETPAYWVVLIAFITSRRKKSHGGRLLIAVILVDL